MAFANAPSIPHILNEMFSGVAKIPRPGVPEPGPGQGNSSIPASVRPPWPMRKPDRRFGYDVFFNIAYDLGYDANVRVMPDGFLKRFPSREAAYAELRRLRPFPDEKLERFKHNMEPLLTNNPKGSVVFHKPTESFVLWWEK
ncbi:MAG: hypothetical protein LBU07_04775 [Coriobacteriales bacterium]|nr:hypothetical protein [Coriobacteriales bacterium]